MLEGGYEQIPARPEQPSGLTVGWESGQEPEAMATREEWAK